MKISKKTYEDLKVPRVLVEEIEDHEVLRNNVYMIGLHNGILSVLEELGLDEYKDRRIAITDEQIESHNLK